MKKIIAVIIFLVLMGSHLFNKYLWILHRFLRFLRLPICQGMGRPCFWLGKRGRQATEYTPDLLNWRTLCPDCWKDNHQYWREQWAEYYGHKDLRHCARALLAVSNYSAAKRTQKNTFKTSEH